MALPKRQHSKQRTRKRRTHDGISAPHLTACSECGKPIVPHRVCPFCGHYKGKHIVEVGPKPKKDKA